MLGAARASQYAGWWSNRPPAVTFEAAGELSYENRQTPSYSLSVGVGGDPAGSLDINTNGNYNLTDYSTNTGFNNERFTLVATIRTEWPTAGIPSEDFVGWGWYNEFSDNGTQRFLNPQVKLNPGNTQLQIEAPVNTVTFAVPGSYADYMDRWLTVVWCSSETSSSYTNWVPPAFGSGSYMRMVMFDTVTGELLFKQDFRTSWVTASIENFPATTPANATGNDYGLSSGSNGSGTDPDFYNTRVSNMWASFGTMFDPLTTTDTSWRTTRPSAVIDTGVAWYNLQTAEYEFVTGSPDLYYVTTPGMDLYSETNNRMARTSGWDSTAWTAAYSDTIITTDQG